VSPAPEKLIAERLAGIEISGIRRVFDLDGEADIQRLALERVVHYGNSCGEARFIMPPFAFLVLGPQR